MGTNTSDQDFILYKAIDDLSESSLGLITFNIPGGTVFAGRSAPLALTDEVEVMEDIAKTISFVGFDADTAFSGDAFVTITQQPSHGSIDDDFVLIVDGVDELAQWTRTYTPDLDFSGTDEIKFTVNNPDNSESESGEATISITVNAVNDLPTISAVGDTTIVEDGSLVLNVEAIDADNLLTLSHVSNDANFVTSWVNDTLSVTPDPNYSGTATITVTATEDGGENAQISESFNVVVTPVNDSPQMTSIEDQATSEDEVFSLVLNADDVEGDEFEFSLTTSPSDLMEINYDTGEITWTPENDDVGEHTITAVVSDSSASDTVSFVLTVENVNDAPAITVPEGLYPGETDEDTETTFRFIPQDVDADDDSLNVTVASLDLNLVPADSILIDPAGPFAADDTITVTLKPLLDQYGVTSIILEVMDDDSAKTSKDLTFTVNNVNDAPVVAGVVPQQTWEEHTLQITLNVTDVDNDYGDMTISAVSENEGIVNLNTDNNDMLTDNVLILTPVPDAVGVATVWVMADDGQAENSDSDTMFFDLTILNINDLPTIGDIGQIPENGVISGTEDTPKIFPITLFDPDPQDFLTLSVSTDNPVLFPEDSIAIDPVTDVSGVVREIVFNPAANQHGSAVVMISVTDGSETVTEQVLLTVDPANDAPIITPIPNHSTSDGELYSYTVTAMDIEGDALNYSFTPGYQPPEGMEIDPVTGEITWTSENEDVGSTYTISVRVTDNGEPIPAHSEEDYELTVEDANAVPELAEIPDEDEDEDSPITVQITPLDDNAGDNLTVSVITNNVILFPDGSITVEPEADVSGEPRTITLNPAQDQYGEALVVVTVSDGESNISREFTATINPVNDAPVIVGQDSLATQEESSITISLLDLFVTDVDNVYPEGFTMTVGNGDNYEYDGTTITPFTNFAGILLVPVLVSDGVVNSQVYSVEITVEGVNDPPAVFPDSYFTPEEVALIVPSFAGVLINDVDFEGDQIIAELVDDVDHGTLSFNYDGTFSYTPVVDYSGFDQFIYRAMDDQGDYSVVATVTIGVSAVNDVPYAVNESYSMIEDDTLAVPDSDFWDNPDSLGILTNDTDADPDQTLSAYLISNVSHGALFSSDSNSVEISIGNTFNGLFLYNPHENYNGTDEFIYAAFDGYALSNYDTVTITLSAVNDPPSVIGQETLSMFEDTSLLISLDDLIIVDPDNGPEDWKMTGLSGDDYTFTEIDSVYGTIEIFPDSNFSGSLTVPVYVDDGIDTSNVLDLIVSVTNVNDAPVFSLSIPEVDTLEDFEGEITITIEDYFDADDNPSQFSLSPAGVDWANVSIDPNTGTVTMTSKPDSSGTGTFIVTANDAHGGLTEEAFTLTITNVNDSPQFGLSSTGYDLEEDFVGDTTIIISSFHDPDGDILLYSIAPESVSWVNVSIDDSSGTVTIESVPDSSGSQEFTITADDGQQEENSTSDQTFEISVSPRNDAPVFSLSETEISLQEDFVNDTTITIVNPFDAEDDLLTYSISPESVSWVNMSINPGTGTVTIDSEQDSSSGIHTFTVTASDGMEDGFTSHEFELTVTPINDPVAISTPIEDILVFHNTEQLIGIVDLDTLFTDVEDDELEFELTGFNLSAFDSAYINYGNKKVVLEFGSHILNGDVLTQFIGEAELSITATEVSPSQPDESGVITPTSSSDSFLVTDKIEPTFEIGVMHNTIAPGFMQFYLFKSEVILEDSFRVEIKDGNSPIDTLAMGTNTNLESAPYFANSSTDITGTLTLQVSAEDLYENPSDTTYDFTIQPILAKLAQNIPLGKSGVFMDIPEYAFSEDDYLIAMPDHYGFQYIHQEVSDDPEDNLISVFNISTMGNHYQQDVAFGVQSDSLLSWIEVTPGYYRLTDGDWEYIPTFVLMSEQKIWCLIDKPGTYVLKQGAERSPMVLPEEFSLRQNYPNPFNPRTIIEYDIPYNTTGLEQAPTSLVVYDLLGREVATLVDESLSPGKYSIVWNGGNKFGNRVASGVYFYSLRTGTFSNTRKMILLR